MVGTVAPSFVRIFVWSPRFPRGAGGVSPALGGTSDMPRVPLLRPRLPFWPAPGPYGAFSPHTRAKDAHFTPRPWWAAFRAGIAPRADVSRASRPDALLAGGTPSARTPEVRPGGTGRASFHLPPGRRSRWSQPRYADGGRRGAARAGVNRLSLGVSPSTYAELRLLGGLHDRQARMRRGSRPARAGFPATFSLDPHFRGCPRPRPLGQSCQCPTAGSGADPGAPSTSRFTRLTVDPGTRFGADPAGQIPAPDPDLRGDVRTASARLLETGYWQYEISNWALGTEPPRRRWQLPTRRATVGRCVLPRAYYTSTYWRYYAVAGLRCRRPIPGWRAALAQTSKRW